ncbi:hypothetical protein NPS01_33870 [Nocardioides psychrotolerans]|uniref:Uncharacterized protein n=1 Tax=Nocardioides psychrotolerans TaxID=1005945 RepID=A0A1I3PQ72_9ACTN|nr:hypothetical protein [Nocardioides psychrotolerans]GEP39724.1 hypothetical protein NPS01_33870 [Nocardioides psychrotolerans]SFJ23136.1 hypothetical protein SAMN05216561_12151 [Nocardioides psychrotolerans]
MAEEDTDRPSEGHPVLTGVVALVAVALTVGLILGGGALAVSRVLGIGGSDEATSGSTVQETMFLPPVEPTNPDSEPLLTLAPNPEGSVSQFPSDEPSEEEPESSISLQAGQTEVGAMERIDLTGVYPGGEGAILQVQQFENGTWGDFPVTATVSNETFTTYIQTGKPGPNRFRVVDTDDDEISNEVKVTIG